jgi:hypothetical protein
MATLIPAIGSCVSRMTSGEKRFANRLEDKLEDDYLCWYDVSIGERTQHPDFVVFHLTVQPMSTGRQGAKAAAGQTADLER